jgi:D-alanyl-D-alanine carboxypeptidase (penicillin-binding protein 5/6)
VKLIKPKNYFLYFVMVVFVFVSTTALSLGKTVADSNKNFSLTYLFQKSFPDNPVLKDGGSFPVISAEGALAVDLASGVTLYEKNADATLLPASTTKIITALVALDTYPLEQVLTVPPSVNVDGQKMKLYAGEQMTAEDLLYGLLVYSANDAAMALAIDYPGGYDAFIDAMNQKAKALSMTNSHFENPVGLDGMDQTTTAKDLLRASEVAMRNPEFAKIVGTEFISFSDVSGRSKYNLKNVNELLGSVPGVSGIKTGWTENARENLVTYIERDGHRVIIVLLGSQDRFGETKQLIDWIFGSYEWQEVKVTTLLDSSRQ